MIRRPPRSTLSSSSAASDVYKRQAPTVPGLGEINGSCRLLQRETGDSSVIGPFKVPHVGWNGLHRVRGSWILEGVAEGQQVYFTHSFAAPITDECVGSTRYGMDFASVVQRDHLVGVQFHPEKSGEVGLRVLKNFLNRIRPSSVSYTHLTLPTKRIV